MFQSRSDASPTSRRRRGLGLFVALIAGLLAAGGCLEVGNGSGTGSDAAAGDGSSTRRSNQRDSVVVGPDGGAFQLLGGEVALNVPKGTLKEVVTVTLERAPVQVRGVELVGYIWGPHGMPIDPAARIDVRMSRQALVHGVDPVQAGLFRVDSSGDSLVALENAARQIDPIWVTYTADLAELGTVVVGVWPLPSP